MLCINKQPTNNMTLQQYQEKIKLAIQYNKEYYDDDNPTVSDSAYDKLMNEIKSYEAQHPDHIDPTSPTQHVGGTAKTKKVPHKAPLLSLQDIFNQQELLEVRHDRFNGPVTVETKVDGLSLALTYKAGNLVQGLTRGNGRIGEDVTPNAKAIINVPKTIDMPDDALIIIRCEAYLSQEDVDRMNADPANSKKPFKNPRNAAAGTLRTSDPSVTAQRGLKAVAFQILYAENMDIPKMQADRLEWLSNHGFQTVHFCQAETDEEILDAIELIDQNRSRFPFDIDGAVVKLNDTSLYETIGETDKYPKWAVAYKYPAESKETKILDIITQTGRTGVITPVAVFEPIQLAGTTVQKATLHNMNFIETILGGIAIGDTVKVHKSGEIIPEILEVTHRSGNKNFNITECPVCHAKAVLGADENGNGTQMYCSNPNCPAMLQGHLIHWCNKSVMDIPGLGPKSIESILKAKLCTSLAGLYDITENQLITLFKEKRGKQMYQAIQTSKNRNIDKLIAGLGLPGIGHQIGELLAVNYPDMTSIMQAAKTNQLNHLEGIGEITANVLKQFADSPEGQTMLSELENKGINMKSQMSTAPKQIQSKLSGKIMVISGSLPGISRKAAENYLKEHGAIVRSSMSDKVDYLVTEGDTTSSKYMFALQHRITMLSWNECLLMTQQS